MDLRTLFDEVAPSDQVGNLLELLTNQRPEPGLNSSQLVGAVSATLRAHPSLGATVVEPAPGIEHIAVGAFGWVDDGERSGLWGRSLASDGNVRSKRFFDGDAVDYLLAELVASTTNALPASVLLRFGDADDAIEWFSSLTPIGASGDRLASARMGESFDGTDWFGFATEQTLMRGRLNDSGAECLVAGFSRDAIDDVWPHGLEVKASWRSVERADYVDVVVPLRLADSAPTGPVTVDLRDVTTGIDPADRAADLLTDWFGSTGAAEPVAVDDAPRALSLLGGHATTVLDIDSIAAPAIDGYRQLLADAKGHNRVIYRSEPDPATDPQVFVAGPDDDLLVDADINLSTWLLRRSIVVAMRNAPVQCRVWNHRVSGLPSELSSFAVLAPAGRIHQRPMFRAVFTDGNIFVSPMRRRRRGSEFVVAARNHADIRTSALADLMGWRWSDAN